MFSKKSILETSFYLLGDKEIDEKEFLAIYEIAIKRRQHQAVQTSFLLKSFKESSGLALQNCLSFFGH